MWVNARYSADSTSVPAGWEEDVSAFDEAYFDGVAF
jgi:hypothetical protein